MFYEKEKKHRKPEEYYILEKEKEMKAFVEPIEEHSAILEKQIENLAKELSKKSEELETVKGELEKRTVDPEINSLRLRLILKEKHIDKLNKQINNLEETVETLKVENKVLENKKYQGSIFTPKAYNRYNQIGKEISELEKLKSENRDLKL